MGEAAWTYDAEAALAEAERRIEESGDGWWYGQRPHITALERLPRNLGKLTSTVVDISETAISDIAGLSCKRDVQSLLLNDRVSDVSVVGDLGCLERLVAYKAPIGDISALRCCRSLRTLQLNVEQVADLSPLAEVPNLERLELWKYRGQPLWPGAGIRQLLIIGAPPGSLDLAPLKTWSRLEMLSCSGAAIAGEFPILPNVTNLSMPGCDDDAFRSLAGYSALETLFAYDGPVSDLTALAPCAQLKTVYVSKTPVASIEPLLDKRLLETIGIEGTAVGEISCLSWLPRLRYLNAGQTPVRDLARWNPDSSIWILSIPGTQVSSLEGLRSRDLLRLDIAGTRVSDLGFVAGIPSLMGLNFKGTEVADLSPVLAHPRLIADASGYDHRDRGPSIDFANTPLARSDPALQAISEITDSQLRQAALRRHFDLGNR